MTVTSYQDQNQVYNDMVAGRLDGTLVMSAAGQSGFLDKPQGKVLPLPAGRLRMTPSWGTGIGYGLRKGDSQLKTALDEAISKVQADGTVTRLAAKYFPGIDVTASKQP